MKLVLTISLIILLIALTYSIFRMCWTKRVIERRKRDIYDPWSVATRCRDWDACNRFEELAQDRSEMDRLNPIYWVRHWRD
jgi:hypothetical protein